MKNNTSNVVIRTAGNVIDVFHGQQGWDKAHWTRLLKTKDGLKKLAGVPLATPIYNYIKAKV